MGENPAGNGCLIMYRNGSFNEDLSRELQDPDFAQGFILDLMEGDEGLSLAKALKTTIESMGVKEFCDLSGMSKQNVNDFIQGRRNLKRETMDAFLKPFHLRTRIVVEKAS